MGLLLKCEHVDFGYENQDAVIDVSLEVSTGDYICIVGENGSGKSTLMKGILGLLKPTEGKIEISEELKKAGIGYLPQQTAAQKDFPATVFEVVISGCLGKRGNRPFYSPKEKQTALSNLERLGIADLKKSCFRDLSGGQKQRISIARVFLKNPAILILDEATSALDNESEYLVSQSLEKLAVGRTTLTIAHRLTTIQGADRILVLAGNKIVEEGNHEQLLEKKGMYYQLYTTANRLNQGIA